ncbi:MAG: WhiB family transcriptional regulator [Acidimicrobiales bacterium]
MCDACPVRQECLSFALADETLGGRLGRRDERREMR